MFCYGRQLHVAAMQSEGHLRVLLGTYKVIHQRHVCMFRYKGVTLRYIKSRLVTHETIEVKFRD